MSFVIIEFKAEYNGSKSTDMVLLAPRGEGFERSQTWYSVKSLIPKEGGTGQMADIMRQRWEIIGPAYEAWKKGEEVPQDGTPLGAWGGVNQDQAKFLKQMGIVTVEQVAEMTDSDVMSLPFPGRRDFPKLANLFLTGKDKSDLAEKNAALLERISAMEEMLTAEKPKRGRPKKVEAA